MDRTERQLLMGEGKVTLKVSNPRELKRQAKFKRGDVVSLQHSYPLRLLVPEHAGSGSCRWIYPITFGGGMVGGDVINIHYHVGEHCAALITSQDSTKIYHCKEGGVSEQNLTYHVSEDAFLAVLGDPVVCFAKANFSQIQRVYLSSGSSLVLLDWLTAGRMALNELWQFDRYQSLIEVYMEDELVFKENQELVDTPCHSLLEAMKGYQVLGTCVVMGEDVQHLVAHLKQLYGTPITIDRQLALDVICSYSPIEMETKTATLRGCYLRFLAASTSKAFTVVKEITSVLTDLLGGNPYARKY